MKVISEIEVERILSMAQNDIRENSAYVNPEKVSHVTSKDIGDYAIECIEQIRRVIKTKTHREGN